MESVEDQIEEQLRDANYDEDADDDFVPEDDDEPEGMTFGDNTTKAKPQIKKRKRATLEDLDGVKRQKINEEENEADAQEEEAKPIVNSAIDHLFASMQSTVAPKKKKKKPSSMDDIFAQLNNPKKSKKQAPKKKAPKIATVSDLWSTLESKDAKDKLVEDAKKMKSALKTKDDDTEVITETYEFAGQTITREKRVKKQANGEKDISTLPTRTKKKSALANVLKGVSKVNSMAKSAMDWDQFKEKENLEEDLAKNRQDGYLKKQQFLIEADHADLDRERVVRDINRRRRDANKPKK